MKKASEVVQKVESHYVGDDCIQVMIPYWNTLAILNQEGIIYSHEEGSYASINTYIEDERRKQFPYSNIPIYYSRVGLFDKVTYANQLLNFEEPYIRIGDGEIIESFAVKDKSEALLINKILTGDRRSIYATRKELEEIFSNSTIGEEKKYIIYLDNDSINIRAYHPLANEETIYKFIQSQIAENVADFREYERNNWFWTKVGRYLLAYPLFLDFAEQSAKSFDLNKMKLNVPLEGGRAIILKTNGNDMSLQYVKAYFIGLDNYRIDIVDMPVNKYTLEQLKHFSPIIVKTKEPRISLKLNPGISRKNIQEAKQMIKSLKQ